MLDKENFQKLLADSRAADQIDRKRATEFAKMVQSEGWKLYVELLELRLQAFSDQLLQPLESLDRAGLQEFVKGAMFAFVLQRDLASVIVATMGREDSDDA